MSDPKYLTDEGAEATDMERELLSAAQGVGLSAPEKRAIWANVALRAVPAPAGSVLAPGNIAPGAAAKASAGLAPWLKGLLVICGLSGISAVFFGLRHREQLAKTAPSDVPSARVAEAAPPASAGATSDLPSAPNAVPSAGPVEASSAPSVSGGPVLSKSALREESLAVLQIRSALRGGDASGALHLLDQARQRFPHGALSQEREALSIEALAKSGARDAAAHKANAFLRAHPKSPYAADVQSFKSN